jgi:predicted N-acyltransferase
MPMVMLRLEYKTFEDYMIHGLRSRTRAHMRRNFRDAARGAPIDLTVVVNISPFIEEVFPLYENVYARSGLHFEKLTKEYFCNLGQRVPDKSQFFIWRRSGKIIAFTYCMIQDDALYSEYIGMDYSVALKLHLYYVAFRDMVSWAMSHGYKWYRSSGLNYDPKYHLGCKLDPIDLYVRHTSPIFNAFLKHALPLLEPVRYDNTLKKFSNYDELWGR